MSSSRGTAPVLLRQGLLLLVLLALTALVTIRVGQGINPRYEVTATATVLAGAGSYSGQEVYGSISHTNQVLALVLDSTTTRDRVAGLGLDPDYEVVAQQRRTLLEVSVHSRTPELGLGTVAAVLDIGSQELLERQALADTPTDARYTLSVLRPPTVSGTAPWRVRNMSVTALLGTVLAVLLSVAARPVLARPRVSPADQHRPAPSEPSASG